jgi:hypothetical protein
MMTGGVQTHVRDAAALEFVKDRLKPARMFVINRNRMLNTGHRNPSVHPHPTSSTFIADVMCFEPPMGSFVCAFQDTCGGHFPHRTNQAVKGNASLYKLQSEPCSRRDPLKNRGLGAARTW